MTLNKLYTAQQSRELDKLAIEQQFNNNDFILMQRAGASVFNKIKEFYHNKNLIIFCGFGNNGGDGLVVANLALEHGYKVKLVLLFPKQKLSDLKLSSASNQAYSLLAQNLNKYYNNIEIIEFNNNLNLDLKDSIIIDAIFGTGLNQEPKGPSGDYKLAIDFINNSKNNNKLDVISVDIPSGLLANTGVAYSSCVKATMTVTFIAKKQGLYTADGPDHSGIIFFDDLGVSSDIYSQVKTNNFLLTAEYINKIIQNNFSDRLKNSHKHMFGEVLVIGGDHGMLGAPTMASLAALRVGAGLVSVVANLGLLSKDDLSEILSYPELMLHNLDLNNTDNINSFYNLINRSNSIVIGPGLGTSIWSEKIFNLFIEYCNSNNVNSKNIIIDADGLRILSKYLYLNKTNLSFITNNKLVLTPHPGEAKILLNNSFDINNNRFEAIKLIVNLFKNYNSNINSEINIILKGCGSLIYNNQNNNTAVCPFGNPAMATAGMGDILSGIIAGLLAQASMHQFDIVNLAVYLHAKAGDINAEKYGVRGMIATDILLEIRKLLNLK